MAHDALELATLVTPEVVGDAEFAAVEVVTPPVRSGMARRVLTALDRGWEFGFGIVALWIGLAVLASIPLLQLLSLGYLLEASGRVARTGSLRSGLIGVRKAARVGSLVLGVWLLLWLPRFASTMWISARLIDERGGPTKFWFVALVLLTGWVNWHAASAAARGGRLRHFLWPRPIKFLRRLVAPGTYLAARDAVWDFVMDLRLPHYFWLGARGFVGGVVWLAGPITLLALGREAPVVGLLGGALLIAVLLWLPMLQTRLAQHNRFAVLWEVGAVRKAYQRAPLAFLIAIVLTLLLALPLYLLKIELISREAAWLPSLLFVISIFPARLACGWAIARAERRATPRHWLFRAAGRTALIPLTAVYVLLVYFTQYLSWYGVWSLYEQHAFLVPVPFLGG